MRRLGRLGAEKGIIRCGEREHLVWRKGSIRSFGVEKGNILVILVAFDGVSGSSDTPFRRYITRVRRRRGTFPVGRFRNNKVRD